MEWKNCKISDLGKIVTGKTPKTTIKENYGGDFPFLSPSDNMGQKHISKTAKTLTILGKNEVKKSIIPCGSVCVSCIGSDLGKVVISGREMVTNQQINSIIPNKENDGDFIYYLMSIVGKELNFLSKTSTAIPIINKSTFSNTNIRIPVNLSDQRKIAGILSALDAKIENNNKTNANLEAQAEALFKSWFVDFTPFKDQPFVDSELGPIPQGWKVGKLGDYVEIKRGGSPRPIQKFLASQGLNWLKISDATSTQSPFIFNIKEKIIINGLKKTVFLKAGSLVLSNSATPCIPKFLSIDSCIHDGWLYFPHSQLPENYLYLFFKLMRNNLVSKANGSVFLNLKTDIVKNQVFAFSGEEIYNSFDKIIAPLFKEIENLTYETFQLSALRDTLLPKLMSGEIKL